MSTTPNLIDQHYLQHQHKNTSSNSITNTDYNTIHKLNSRRNSNSKLNQVTKRHKTDKSDKLDKLEINEKLEKGEKIVKPEITQDTSFIKKLPLQYIKCEKADLITIISRMLTSIVLINDSTTSLDIKYLSNEYLTRFHSRSPPQISIYNYLLRLSHYSSLENCVLIATVYYIDLLTRQYPSFALNSLTVHRFLLTATTIASKALCDSFCSNNHYAKVGGVNVIELNLLEVEFLKWVNYRVVPRDFNYDSICERKNSANGNVEVIMNNSLKYGISTADKILDLYYEKMISLVGSEVNDENGNMIPIGHNDGIIFSFNTPTRNSVGSISSNSLSISSDED